MTEKEFETKWINKLKEEKKSFPDGFVELSDYEELKIKNKILTLGSEFFGSYEIIDTDGIVLTNVPDYVVAKFYFYSSLERPDSIRIPTDESLMIEAVKKYESYLDTLLKEIGSEFRKQFPESKNQNSISNQIFNIANLKRY